MVPMPGVVAPAAAGVAGGTAGATGGAGGGEAGIAAGADAAIFAGADTGGPAGTAASPGWALATASLELGVTGRLVWVSVGFLSSGLGAAVAGARRTMVFSNSAWFMVAGASIMYLSLY